MSTSVSVNVWTGAASHVEGFRFLSIFKEKGKLYGILPSGVVEIGPYLDGTNPIKQEVILGSITLDTQHRKRLLATYIDAPVIPRDLVGIVNFDKIPKLEYPYTRRVTVGRGALGNAVQIGFRTSQIIQINSISYTYENLTRRNI